MRQSLSPILPAGITVCSFATACNDKARTDTAATADSGTTATTTQSTAATAARAKEGDTVWVLVTRVKAEKRQQFERFIHDVFWDSSAKLSSDEQRVFRQTRVLHPTKAEKDGTYSYIFLMDPYISGGDYDIGRLLKKMYGNRASEFDKTWSETVVGDQTAYIEVQSRH